ncbi:MAG: type I methionyl aminopeptidase [Candidatus Taylorbacteria bacterium]|nr:type I methionyl aminopeptidase [Candidatus Taylorbacteria bacterium]
MITIKTKEEIAILREGGRRHAEILEKLKAMVKPGVLARSLNDEAERLIKEGGDTAAFLNYKPKGAKTPFPASLCVSINNEVVHGIPNATEKILKEGDIVSLDLGLVHKGLITDSAITVAVGNISPELSKLLQVTEKALEVGIKAIKAGKRVGDISIAIERVGIAGGVGIVEELAGHGVGYSVHEDPFIPNYGEAGKGDVLQPGMVIAIEPIFNLGSRHVVLDKDAWTYRTKDGKPSAHFEHTVAITKGGAEVLTTIL